MESNRYTVAEAAEVLGISPDAVRKRIKRDALKHGKDDQGRIIVFLDTSNTRHTTGQEDALVEELRDRVRSLERQLDVRTEELRENRRLFAGLIERIPEIEGTTAPPEPRESPESAEPRSDRGTQEPEKGTERRSWWRRLRGG